MSLLKIFLIIYAASAIFTSVTQEIFMIIALKRIEKELNKFAPGSQIIFFKDFKSILENILKTLFISIIPIFNMVYPWIIIFNFEKIYPNVKKDYINDEIFFGGRRKWKY